MAMLARISSFPQTEPGPAINRGFGICLQGVPVILYHLCSWLVRNVLQSYKKLTHQRDDVSTHVPTLSNCKASRRKICAS